MMPEKLAYLMGAPPKPSTLANIAAGKAPRAEYNVFLQRHPATLLTSTDVENSGQTFAHFLSKRGQPHFALAAVALAGDYDAFITTGEDIGLPLALMAKLRGIPKPIHIITHGSFFGSRKFAQVMRLLRNQNHVQFLTLSQTLADRLVDTFGIPTERAFNASYATDTSFFQPLAGAPEAATSLHQPPMLASVGAAYRDYKTLVQAVTGLPVQVNIGADSAWFPAAIDIEGQSLPANVDVRKYAYPELRQLYADALFVVVPLYEGKHACGYSAIAEAMAMGKAVIATQTTNYSDFIQEGETGLYARPGDLADLREKIQTLLNDPELAQQMGRTARERMASRYSVEAYSSKIESAIGLV